MMEGMRKKGWRLLIAIVCQLLILQWVLVQPVAAQQPLRVVVLEGEGNKNVTQQISPRPLVVRVEANNGSVEGAVVTFTAPSSGPSGDFSNDSRTIRVTSGPDGTASPGLYHPDAIQGRYSIQVRADYQGAMATASIAQTNVGQGGHKKLIAILAIGGAAAAAAVIARNKNTPTSPATITFGGSAVGAPR